MIKYVILDFDGTIADSAALYIRLANNLAGEFGLEKLDIDELRLLSTMPIKESKKRLGVPLYRIPAMNIRMQEEVKKHIHELDWIEGMERSIRALKDAGIKLAIISSNSTANIKRFLKNKGCLDVFDEIFSTKGLFDKHRAINKLIKKLGVKKHETVYIGDEYRDIKACKKSGVKIISVTWGFDSETLLIRGEPDFIANTPLELVKIISGVTSIKSGFNGYNAASTAGTANSPVTSEEAKSNMAKDTFLYLAAKAIEGIVRIIALSLYTRFFIPEQYGNYNIAIVTVSISALVILGWIFQSAYRYINSFTGEKNIRIFYSTVFTGWLMISVITVSVSFIVLLFIKQFFDSSTVYLILLSILMFIPYSINQILFSLLSAVRVIRLNLLLSILSAVLKLLVTLILVKFLYQGIHSAIASALLVDIFTAVVIIIRLKIYKYVKFSLFSESVMKMLVKFGMPLVGVSLSLSLLNNIDRYIIKFLQGSSEVGIYVANYSIASSVFTMLMLAIMKGIYPNILKAWKQDEKEKTEELLSHGVRFFLLISIPAVVGISVLSSPISRILEPQYAEGSSVMIWVSMGMFFMGLSEYNNKAWELASSTGTIFRNSSLCCIFNIILNILTVHQLGYIAAAVNTTLAYFLYFLLTYAGGRKLLKWHLPFISLTRIIGSAMLMGVILYLAIQLISITRIYMLLILVPAGVIIYGVSLYISGEIKHEVKQAAAKIRRILL